MDQPNADPASPLTSQASIGDAKPEPAEPDTLSWVRVDIKPRRTKRIIQRFDVQVCYMLLAALAVGFTTGWIVAASPKEANQAVHATPLRIDLNAASAADLSLLPSIGPRLADSIVADRNQNGHFRTLEDLRRLRGIGPERINQLRAFLFVGLPSESPTSDSLANDSPWAVENLFRSHSQVEASY